MTKSWPSISTDLRAVSVAMAMLLLAGFCFGKTTISLSSTVGPPTTKFQVSGSGFTSSVKIDLYFDAKNVGLATANGSGSFSKVTISVPTLAQPGNHTVKAVARQGTASATATFLVRTDWAQFHRSNMQRWNQYENTLNINNVGRLQVKWKANTGGAATSPVVAGGIVYVNSDGAYYQGGYAGTFALDASTGVQKWYGEYNEPFGDASPAVANGVLYSGVLEPESLNQDVFALDAITGRWEWGLSIGGMVDSTPVVANGAVYIIGSEDFDGVYALNAATGAILWSFIPGRGSSSSPAVANGMVYVGSNNNSVYALNATTGAKVWSYATGGSVTSSPAVVGGVVYVGSADHNVYALDATTGALLWLYATGGDVISSPAVANGVVYIGSNDQKVYALSTATGTKLWSYSTAGAVYSSPAVANGVVYFASSDGKVYALNARTGAKLWSYATASPRYGLASPIVADGVVYFGAGQGDNNVYAFGLK